MDSIYIAYISMGNFFQENTALNIKASRLDLETVMARHKCYGNLFQQRVAQRVNADLLRCELTPGTFNKIVPEKSAGC